MKKKNILFVCDFPFAGAGGVGRVTEVLATEFLARGCGVAFLALCSGREDVCQGVRQYFLPQGVGIGSSESLQYVQQLLGSLEVDVIINQAGTKMDVLDFLDCLKTDMPILSVHHNCVACLRDNYRHIFTENFKSKSFFKLLDHKSGWQLLDRYHLYKQGKIFRKAMDVSDRLVLLSEVFVPEVETYVPDFQQNKVIGIPNPAPFKTVEGVESKKENRLLFVGRVNIQQKRVDLLLDLWQRMYRDFPDWDFDIVGDGPDRQALEARARAEGLPRIHFHGFQDPRPYLEKAKFFCMTSAFEGFGMVLVEAQAYGVVPFAFDCFSALGDIIEHEKTGFVIPKFLLTDYTAALKNLMKDEKCREKMSLNCRAAVTRFAPDRIADQWLALMNKVNHERRST